MRSRVASVFAPQKAAKPKINPMVRRKPPLCRIARERFITKSLGLRATAIKQPFDISGLFETKMLEVSRTGAESQTFVMPSPESPLFSEAKSAGACDIDSQSQVSQQDFDAHTHRYHVVPDGSRWLRS